MSGSDELIFYHKLLLAKCLAGDLAQVQLLSKKIKAEDWLFIINRPNTIGTTPLVMACRNGNFELVSFLLKNSAAQSINQGSSADTAEDKTPLLWALHHGNIPLMKLLLEYGARPEFPGKPFLSACWRSDSEVLKFLLDKEVCPA